MPLLLKIQEDTDVERGSRVLRGSDPPPEDGVIQLLVRERVIQETTQLTRASSSAR